MIAGPSIGSSGRANLLQLAEATGFVLLAESTSGQRLDGRPHPQRCDGFPHLLADARLASTLVPDLVMQFGMTPASGALARWLDTLDVPWVRVCDGQPAGDAEGRALQIFGDSADLCQHLAEVATPSGHPDYLQTWRAAETLVWAAVEDSLAGSTESLSEAKAIATVLAQLPAGAQLSLGNSMPVRAADAVLPGAAACRPVLHQRGASGIDGLIAGAIGSSSTAPSALLLGDVSFAHDLSSLQLARDAAGPLAIIVIDNAGGQIFSHLPVSDLDLREEQWDLWRTRPEVDYQSVCAGYQVPYRQASDDTELHASMAWARQQERVCVLHVIVEPSSMRDFLRDVGKKLAGLS